METLIIFCAKYIFVLSPLISVYIYYKAPSEIKRSILKLAIVTLSMAFILGSAARQVWFNPRPFVVEGFSPLIFHLPDNGFPSDHVLLLASLASVIFFMDRRRSWSLWLIAFLVGGARVAAGVHHMTDILGSIVIALASTALAHAIIQKLWNKNINPENQTNY